MEKINIEKLETLYKSYGFEVSNESELVPIFLYQKSRYFGVDIILTNENPETLLEADRVKEKYSHIGYAINIKQIGSNNEAELELFKSFFSFDTSIQRLCRKYGEFKKKQTKALLGHSYEYVESPFEIQNHLNDEKRIFDIVQSRFTSEKAELIIIEAAAGYGKTCTAYEILKYLTQESQNQIPIFTELSRNRAAKIFRYILLDEIDIEYSSLNSDLVIKEIKNGRIPLIIDGFDELLVKVNTDAALDDAFEEVESMLDTIGSLLVQKTKIVLTTRKTAIFTGVEFDTWLNKWNNKFQLTRIGIKEPRLKDWLGEEKYIMVVQKNVPIEYLANPVVLTFLKNIPLLEFAPLMDYPDVLVEQYFEKMLEREKERHNLIMTVEKQLEVFRNVVRTLVELDTAVEDKDFFKEIVLEQNRKLIEYTRSLYSGPEKPSLENLVDTLSTHALLDRKGRDQSQIGFINDFVLGTFVGQIIADTPIEKIEKEFSVYMIELAVTAYRVQTPRVKGGLWEKINSVLHKFQPSIIFTFDAYLKRALQRDYSEISIYDHTFFHINLIGFQVDSSVFINCNFKNCFFESNKFSNTSFINCVFDNCSVIDAELIDDKNGITAIKCKQEHCSILIEDIPSYTEERQELVTELEKEVLHRLWSTSLNKVHHILKLMQFFSGQNKKNISKSLKSLEEKGYITIRGSFVHFEINKIYLIKEILAISHEI
jgi:hypothetical protein